MKHHLIIIFLFTLISNGCSNTGDKSIVLNSEIENGLLEFWESNLNDKKRGNLPICLSLYEFDGINRVGISFSQIYSENNIKGLFYLDSIPVLLLIEDSFRDKKMQQKVFENANFKKLRKNQIEFIENNNEDVSDSFDPPTFLYEIHADGLKRVP
tara:strand:- start:1015 stop:1479 length:465 start_codon:yes stop_codon:yes gene_type:complete